MPNVANLAMDCSECDRLWRTYPFATRQHLQIIKAQEEAALSDDIERMMEVEEALRAAEEWRGLARKAVRDHERAAHPEKKISNTELALTCPAPASRHSRW